MDQPSLNFNTTPNPNPTPSVSQQISTGPIRIDYGQLSGGGGVLTRRIVAEILTIVYLETVQ